MKRYFILPRFKKLSLVLMLCAGVLIVTETSCVREKPGCGSKRDHRVRKRRVHKFAPTMGFIQTVKPASNNV